VFAAGAETGEVVRGATYLGSNSTGKGKTASPRR
jgi:hypothetical protein